MEKFGLHVNLCILNSYYVYLDACAKIVRSCLKDEFRSSAVKLSEVGLKASKWASGKQGEYSIFY